MPDRRYIYRVEIDQSSARMSAQQLRGIYERELSQLSVQAQTPSVSGMGGMGGTGGGITARGVWNFVRNPLGLTVGGVAVGAMAAQAMRAVNALAEVGAQVERVSNSYEMLARSAGESSQAMLQAMREASRGTISDADLMLSANRAMMLGVADTAEEMATLLEIASARGRAMGLTTAQAFDDIVTGLGRGSAMILDNLGIVVDLQRAYEQYAATLGKTARELTEAEKKQALINQVLQDGQRIVEEADGALDDSAAASERLAASWANMRAEMGQNIAPDVAAFKNFWADVVDGITWLASEESKLQAQVNAAARDLDFWRSRAEAAGGESEELAALVADAEVRFAQLNAQLILTQGELDTTSGSTAQLRGEFYAMGDAAEDTIPKIRAMTLEAQVAAAQFDLIRGYSQDIADQIGSAATRWGAALGGEAGLALREERSEWLRGQVRTWRGEGYSEEEIANVLLPGMVRQITEAEAEAQRLQRQTASEAGRAWKQAAAEAEREWREAAQKFADKLTKIPGLFGTSDVTQEQMDLAGWGIPQDFADNYLRRLADEVLNKVEYEDVDIYDAARRAGIDASLPPEAILSLFTQAWRDSSLFADPKNLELINMEAVHAGLARQQDAEAGRANLMALFGLTPEGEFREALDIGRAVGSKVIEGTLTMLPDGAAQIVTGVESGLTGDQAITQYSAAGTAIADDLFHAFATRAGELDWAGAILGKLYAGIDEALGGDQS